jgi:uncharacterized membrane protein YccC
MWHGVWLRLRDRGPQLRLALRVTTAAIVAFLLSQFLTVPLAGLWAVLTSVVVTQMSVGSSLKAAIEYGIGTLGGAIFAGAVATLVPHNSEATLLLVLALAVAPMALLASLNPHFRVAPFTAVLVVLGSTATHIGPIGSAAYRVLEVGLGGLTGLVVSLLVLPARAHTLVIGAAAAMLDLLARSLPRLFSGFTRDLDALEIAEIQANIAAAYVRIETSAGEATREQMTYLAAEPDPGPLLRALRRLRHDLIMIGRAAGVPLPRQFQEVLGPPLTRFADAATAYLRACSAALRARRGPPALTEVKQALDAYVEVIATARRERTMRDLPVDAVERIFALGFALDHMQENFGDLARCVGEFAQPGKAEPVKPG